MPETPQNPRENDYPRRILDQLLLLRAAGGFDPTESAGSRGVWRWSFRSGGWPVGVDLDTSVLAIRVYHGRDEVAMAPVPERLMTVLLGRERLELGGEKIPSKDEILTELRRIVAHWKAGNARIFIQPPVKVGHPDTGNRA